MYKIASRYLQHRAFLGHPISDKKRNGQGEQGIPKKIKQAFSSNELIRGSISHEIKGGYTIIIKGFSAFCPYSEMYPKIKSVNFLKSFQKHDLEFLVLKVSLKSVVVSRKKAAHLRAWEQAKQAHSKHLTLRGTVKDIRQYGAFIDIGGMDGLLHVSEINSKGKNQEIFLKVGQVIKVSVIGLDEERQRVSLSTPFNTRE